MFLIHEGVNFPPTYMPTGYVFYNNKKIYLHPIHEEYLVYWYKLKEHYRYDPLLVKNFVHSLNALKPTFKKCLLFDNEVHKQMTKYSSNFKECSNKVSNKVVYNDNIYEICNYIEVPGIFVGKGNHPLRGHIKTRIKPQDIIINVSKGTSVIKSHPWKSIMCNKNANYIACWKDNIFGKYKYIYINSQGSQEKKFKHCYKLRHKIRKLKTIVLLDITSKIPKIKECALIVYLIMKYNIRIGHEKDEDYTNDSVGCCTLLVKNMIFKNNDILTLSFVGKSNVKFLKSLKIDNTVYQELYNLCKLKKYHQNVFNVNACQVNDYLNSLIPSLTAKVFRTYNASKICYNTLKSKSSLEELKETFTKIALLCNHKKNGIVEVCTSKLNYIDPRIIYSFSKKHNIDISKVYSQNVIKIHNWACNTSENFRY